MPEPAVSAIETPFDTAVEEPGAALAQLGGTDKVRSYNRLRRIEGQVRGLQRMVEEDRACVDILTQIASVQEALRAVGRELLRSHLKDATRTALHRGDVTAETICDELVEMVFRHGR
jgi:CsoR family transcriptional regulator, copper-sensing transcriptional repressor